MNKPKILAFVRYYLPGFKSGGPVRTLANMTETMGDDFDFFIVTADRDALEKRPYDNAKINDWNIVGKSRVFYASPKWKTIRKVALLIRRTPHDILYLNSFFNIPFTLQPLLLRRFRLIPRRPVVIAPRGEFSTGHVNLHRWKYVPFIRLARASRVYRGLVWQASGQGEARDIEREMGEIAKEIHIAPDLTQIIQPPSQSSFCGGGESGPLKVAFLSRISRMKNLDYALTILAKVRLQVQFSIYGVIDDCTYWEECLRMIENLPGNISVAYEGEVPHHEVTSVMAKHDLFFLPTRGENFGHAIYEALASGIPVLVSDQTPWRNLEEVGVGWDFPLSLPQAFISVIENQGQMDQSQRVAQRLRAIEYARAINNDAGVIEQNRELFHECLST